MSVYYITSMSTTLLAVAMLVGCAGNTETSPSLEAKNILNPEAQSVSDVSEKRVNAIPNEFPDDIFVADGPSDTQIKEIGGRKNLILDYTASDVGEFVKQYQDGMAEEGWAVVASSTHSIGTITNFSKEDRKCTISIAPPKDKVIKVAIVLPNR